jgi:integrase
VLYYKTKYFTTKKDFQKGNLKIDVRHDLEKCIDYVYDKFNSRGRNFVPNKHWLHKQCDNYFDVKDEKDVYLIDWINLKILDSQLNENSEQRTKHFKQLISIVKKYNEFLEMNDLTLNELNNFRSWLRNDVKYSLSTTNFFIGMLKTVCRFASPSVNFPKDFLLLQRIKQTKASKNKHRLVITLSEKEIQNIEALDLTEPHLINARKWLIIGVNTAQRGSELLELTKSNFKTDSNGNLMIDFVQKKVGKLMRIPALKKVREFYKNDNLPSKVSMQKLNKHIKVLGKRAKINEMIEWNLPEKVKIDGKAVLRHVRKQRPKYEYLASHIFRRTFCTYYIDKMPEEEIRKISGHESKQMLMTYVNEARPDLSKWVGK